MSVVVPTRNRAAKLAALLAALEQQTLPAERMEVVVVDDASSDETADVLAALVRRGAGTLRVARLERNGGPAAARNVGWRAAKGRTIAFTDDDCRPGPGWLEAGLGCLRDGVGLVMGRTVADENDPSFGRPFSRALYFGEESPAYATCNIFYPRRLLAELGGFDESFRLPCGEDMDLAWRAKEAGHASVFCPDAVVSHDVDPPSFRRFLSDRHRWSEHVHVLKLHPGLRRFYYRRYFFRRSHVHALVTVILVAAAASLSWLALVPVPVVWAERLRGAAASERGLGRLLALGGTIVGDLWELAAFALASIRYRTLLL